MALWDVLKVYGVRGKLLDAVKPLSKDAFTCTKISGETSEYFVIKVGLEAVCDMSPRVLNIYMDHVMREMKGKVGEFGVRMYSEGMG